MDDRKLIDGLVDELAPVARPLRSGPASALWLAVAWGTITALTLAFGPMRTGFAQQLAASPHFLAETLLGLAAGVACAIAMLRLSIPAAGSQRIAIVAALSMTALWFAEIAFGLAYPALEPSMAGKRPHCFIETFVYSAIGLTIAIAMLRRRAPLQREWTGALAGAGAAAVPALLMQLACMYDPWHTLTLHLSPIPVIAGLGALIATRLLPRI